MRFIIVGVGAIGGVVAGRLIESGHDVVGIARGAHAAEIAKSGLRIACPTGAVTVKLEVVTRPAEIRFAKHDVILLAVKGQDTVAVLDEIAAATNLDIPIVCLQNGVNNEREALRRFRNVYGAILMCPTVHLRPGEVRAHSAPVSGLIDIGRYPEGVDDTVAQVVTALSSSTFSSLPRSKIMRWKWAKLLLNLGNVIEAVCGPPARRGELGELVRAEGQAVLRSAGIDFASFDEDEQRRGSLMKLGRVDGDARPGGSSWQSLARGGTGIETDYLNGEIILLGREHGVPTPINERLQQVARHMLHSSAAPGSVDASEILSAKNTSRAADD